MFEPSFSDLVAVTQARVKIAGSGEVIPTHSSHLRALLACIREQQAALEGVIRVADRATDEFDAARNALTKWSLK